MEMMRKKRWKTYLKVCSYKLRHFSYLAIAKKEWIRFAKSPSPNVSMSYVWKIILGSISRDFYIYILNMEINHCFPFFYPTNVRKCSDKRENMSEMKKQEDVGLGVTFSTKTWWLKLTYARHYKPWLVYFLPHFQRPFLCF